MVHSCQTKTRLLRKTVEQAIRFDHELGSVDLSVGLSRGNGQVHRLLLPNRFGRFGFVLAWLFMVFKPLQDMNHFGNELAGPGTNAV